MSCEEKLRNVYSAIMDLYIPSDNPEITIESMLQLDSNELIDHSGDSTWFVNYHNEKIPGSPLKESLLLFKIFSDIHSNQESYKDFQATCESYKNTTKWITKSAYEIGERYHKYLPEEDRIPFVMHVMQTLSESTPLYANECYEFCKEYPEYRQTIPQGVMRCLVGDCKEKLAEKNHISVSDYYALATESLINQWSNFVEKSSPAIEAVGKDSIAMNEAQKKIYKAYKTYKNAEEKVDSQITKGVMGLKNVLTGDVRTEIIEGKKFSAISLLKKLLGTVALFSWGPIKAAITLVVRYALKKKTTESEKRKIIMELETEIEMLEEKINDARGDQNREAKYSMMRTKKELENAKKRIEFGMEASQKDLDNAHKALDEAR